LFAIVLRKNIKSASRAALSTPPLDKPNTVLILNSERTDASAPAPIASKQLL
jgi:hypothetical protein